VDDAQLDAGLGKHRADRIGKTGQLLNDPVLPQNFFLGHAVKIDLLQQMIPLIFLFLLTLGHVCSFGISTTDWPITQTLRQPRFILIAFLKILLC
jgi:hypothetical protein